MNTYFIPCVISIRKPTWKNIMNSLHSLNLFEQLDMEVG